MKRIFFALAFISITMLCTAQNSSGGISISSLQFTGDQPISGLQYTGNIRVQFSKIFGWQTEVGYATLGKSSSTTEFTNLSGQPFSVTFESEQSQTFLRTAATVKLFSFHGMTGEAIVGAGLLNSRLREDFQPMIYGGIFLSTQITSKIVLGLPITYSSAPDTDSGSSGSYNFYDVGVSLRYHL